MNHAPGSYYSQHGEDIVAWKVLHGSWGPRYFVEVGLVDGVRFSNTLAFEQRGWHGLCVEAHPGFVDLVRQNRPGSTVIHAAATDAPGDVTFHGEPRGDLSGLTPHDEQAMRQRYGHWFRGYQPVTVPGRTLDEMLQEADAPPGFELLSIDIEGGEPAALRGFDLAYWRPRLVLLEADQPTSAEFYDDYFWQQGYRLARRMGINVFYARNSLDALRVRLARVDAPVLLTANPSDPDPADRTVIPYAYETRGQYLRRVLGMSKGHAA